MDRLTGYNSFGGVYGIGMRCGDNTEIINGIIKRLAEYENTGLTPQQIEQMKARMPLHNWSCESPEKMSIFGVPVKKIIEWSETEKAHIRDLNDIASAVEEKMEDMCGCINCIEKVKMIIKGDVKPFENQCNNCKIECNSRIT
jgi:hypothetical protein